MVDDGDVHVRSDLPASLVYLFERSTTVWTIQGLDSKFPKKPMIQSISIQMTETTEGT